jgi:hypothetical protein
VNHYHLFKYLLWRFIERSLLSSAFIERPTSEMKCQGAHTFFPLDCINTNHRRLAGELDCCNNRIELGRSEIGFKLLTRLPFFNEQENAACFKQIIKTAGSWSRT